MNDLSLPLLEMAAQGYCCSQMIVLLGLELQGRENPELVRATAGLGHGLGQSGELCGALLGGICLLGLYTGKGGPKEQEHERLQLMVADLVDWFRGTACAECAGIRCADILGDAPPDPSRCGGLVMGVYTRVLEILQEQGIDPTVPKDASL